MKEFKFANCVEVPNSEGIHECYEVLERTLPSDGKSYYSFLANISIENLPLLIERFIESLDEPCFFILEVATNQKEEERLRKSDSDPLHRDVYYIDGCSKQDILKLFKENQEMLIHDGISSFGFASHMSKEEIFIGKYKVTNFFTKNETLVKSMLQDLCIPHEQKIKTVWDNFSKKSPGTCNAYTANGATVYDLVKSLQADGLYLAGRREER